MCLQLASVLVKEFGQLVIGSAGFFFVAGAQRFGSAMLQMVLQQYSFDGPQRLVDRRHLYQHVRAIAFFIHHFLHTAHLTFNPAQTQLQVFFCRTFMLQRPSDFFLIHFHGRSLAYGSIHYTPTWYVPATRIAGDFKESTSLPSHSFRIFALLHYDGCSLFNVSAQLAQVWPRPARTKLMTMLDVVFKYGTPPGEKEMLALNNAWEVYGVRKIKFDEKEHTIRVEYDATRLNDAEIAAILRRAGVDLREKVQLV